MESLLKLILQDPRAFSRSEIPCCLQGIWETQLEAMATRVQPRISPSETALIFSICISHDRSHQMA